MKKHISFLFIYLLISCSGSVESDQFNETQNSGNNTPNNNGNTSAQNTWLIPKDEVKDGGPGKDGIPSLDNPIFIKLRGGTYLNGKLVLGYFNNDSSKPVSLSDNDLVIGILFNGTPIAYPHIILDWHEIVNHGNVTVSYCPLTGTAYGWEAKSGGKNTTFGVSGLIYNSNLILYDRNSDSYWSQMRLECVHGDLRGEKPTLIDVVETDWKTWKQLYPGTQVLSTDTGFNRFYGDYPYGTYKTNHDLFLFPTKPTNNALPNKQRVYALTDASKSKVFKFSQFVNGKAFKTKFNNKDYLIVGNSNLINGYELSETFKDFNFEYDFNSAESVFFKDDNGNKWSIFGEVVSGSRIGQKLKVATSVVSFWFAIAAFHPNFDIFELP